MGKENAGDIRRKKATRRHLPEWRFWQKAGGPNVSINSDEAQDCQLMAQINAWKCSLFHTFSEGARAEAEITGYISTPIINRRAMRIGPS